MEQETEVQQEELKESPKLSARAQAIAEIAKRSHDEHAHEFQDFDESTGEIKPNAPAEQPEEPKQEEPKAEEPKTEAPEDDTVPLKFDGQEKRVPRQTVIEAGIRALQKESAADKRLFEANEAKRQAQELLERAKQQVPSTDVPVEPQAPATTLDPRALLGAVREEVQTSIYWDNAQKARRQFEKDFPEVASDPMLMAEAGRREDQRLAECRELGNPLGDPFEEYRKHGEAIRAWLKSKGLLQPTEDLQAKAAKKRETVVNVPSANMKVPAPTPPKPKTREDILEDMARARRQRI